MRPARPSSRHPGPTASTGWALWRTTLRWQRRVRAALDDLGLTHGQFVVLAVTWWLTESGGRPPSQRQVADHAGTDAMTTSQIVRRLLGSGHLERRPDPADRRARLLALTPRGTELLTAARPAVEAVDAEFFALLGGEETAWRALLLRLDAPRPDEEGGG